jgi:hypothetical protein
MIADQIAVGDHVDVHVVTRALSEHARLLVEEIVYPEHDAQKILDTILGDRSRTIFDLRVGLARAGLWTSSDVEDFDRAVRVRNAVVHGDSYTERYVANASKTVDRLRSRLVKGWLGTRRTRCLIGSVTLCGTPMPALH